MLEWPVDHLPTLYSVNRSIQVSAAASPETRSPTPEPLLKRRRLNNPPSPFRNGDCTYTPTPTAVQSGRSSPTDFVPSPLSRGFTFPSPSSPRFFGVSREYISYILSRGLVFNMSRGPNNPGALGLAAQRLARVPALPTLRFINWRDRMSTWPKAARDEEMDRNTATVRRATSNAW